MVAVTQTCGCARAGYATRVRLAASSSTPSKRCSKTFTSGSLGFQQAAAAQQRVGFGLAAAEGNVGIFRIARAARRIDVVVQPLGHRGVENVPGLLEGAERGGIPHLRPHLAV